MTDTITIAYAGAGDNYEASFFYYVRLGALLQFIENNLMYWIQADGAGSPMLKFDTEVESNLMYIENDLQISVDPTICVVNRTLILDEDEYKFIPDDQNADPFDSPLFPDINVGQIMNIYINMRWALLKLDELRDKFSNKVILIDFLNSILSSVSSALGGLNALEATIDENTNTVIIRDKNPLPYVDSKIIPILNSKLSKNISNSYVLFDLYGYKKRNNSAHASFIKDFNFTTEISPQLSTMLTVGATANSTVVGENSTAFSRFNFGLQDRFKKEIKTSKEEKDKILNAALEEKKILWDKYSITLGNYIAFLKRLSNSGRIPVLGNTGVNIYCNEGDTYKDSLTNLIIYRQQYDSVVKNVAKLKDPSIVLPFLPGTGYIPFNMSLTMDGLSGMKIYNKFYLDTEYLPTNYPENAEFLIKNISHKIENNKWFTTIESIVTTKGDYKNKKKNIFGGGGGGGGGSHSGGHGGGSIPPCPTNLPVVPSGDPLDASAKITWNRNSAWFKTTGIGGNSRNKNVDLIINGFKAAGITNVYGLLGIIATCGKEQGFLPKNEYGYTHEHVSRLRQIFGSRLSKFTDAEIKAKFMVPPKGTADNTNHKADIAFYDHVYGYLTVPFPAWTKHTNPGDGWNFRGRGFNGLTYKASYKKYGDIAESGLGDRLLANPDLANDPDVALKLLVAFFVPDTKSKDKINSFTDACEAIKWAVIRNHGGSIPMAESFTHAYKFATDFFKIE